MTSQKLAKTSLLLALAALTLMAGCATRQPDSPPPVLSSKPKPTPLPQGVASISVEPNSAYLQKLEAYSQKVEAWRAKAETSLPAATPK